MHYFWPTSPLTQPRPRDRAAERAVPDAPPSRQPVWGSNPTNPDNLCGQKVLAFGADRTELVPTANVACGLQPAQLWHPVTNPTGERCGIADFMRAVFGVTVTPDAPNGKGKLAVDNVGVQYGLVALQRGQITPEQFVDLNAQGRRDRHRRQLRAERARSPTRTRCGSPTRPGASTAPRARRTSPRSTTAPARRWTTRASTRPSTPSRYRARLDRSNGNHDNQVIWLSRTGGIVPEPVRRHARAGWTPARSPRPRTLLHGRRRTGRSDLQRHLDGLRQPAPRRGRRRTRSTSSSASSSRSRAATTR